MATGSAFRGDGGGQLVARARVSARYFGLRTRRAIGSSQGARLVANEGAAWLVRLPELKFFGDLGVHNRMALVRKDDLDRLHNPIRAGVEELVRSL